MDTSTLISEQVLWREHPIDALGLSTRSYNALRRFGIETLGQLRDLVATGLITEVRNVGHQSRSEICNKLDAYLATIPESELATVEPSTNDLPALPTSALEGPEPSKTPEPVVSKPSPERPPDIPLQDRIAIWLSALAERDRQVLAWRYGLQGEPLTLEAIGENLGLTRERVRQIEGRATTRLGCPARRSILAPLLAAIGSAFERMGGLLTDSEATEVGGQLIPARTMHGLGVMRLLGKTSGKFHRYNRAGVWIWGSRKQLVLNTQTETTRILKAAMAPINEDDLLEHLRKSDFYRRNESNLPETFLRACLRTHPALEHRENGLVGLARWAKHRTDDIVLALRQIGRPAHYTEVAEIVNESLSADMQTDAHNIHAHMQRMPDVFVWVGRGMYGLAEWGLERSEYYADIVERILCEYGHPLSIQEVLTRVCEVRDCKESTILMLLTLNDRFRAFPGAVYGLAEWRDDEFPDPSYREKRLMAVVGETRHQRKSKPEVAQVLRDIDDLISMVSSEV